ncbi:hypothetical protein BDZ91DRAFT_787364 [Kalaharituber pfeilii]|nr:hypothetical protein BDZ91DRAFT_787364 [Kalaharituber pfeilii]
MRKTATGTNNDAPELLLGVGYQVAFHNVNYFTNFGQSNSPIVYQPTINPQFLPYQEISYGEDSLSFAFSPEADSGMMIETAKSEFHLNPMKHDLVKSEPVDAPDTLLNKYSLSEAADILGGHGHSMGLVSNSYTPPISPAQPRQVQLSPRMIPFFPNKMKRSRGCGQSAVSASSKRLRSAGPQKLGNVEKLLLDLRDKKKMAWKDCAGAVIKETGKEIKVPALQMRLKRCKERFVVWEQTDIERLQEAAQQVENRIQKKRLEWIAEEMMALGSAKKYSPASCDKKLKELAATAVALSRVSPPSTQACHNFRRLAASP